MHKGVRQQKQLDYDLLQNESNSVFPTIVWYYYYYYYTCLTASFPGQPGKTTNVKPVWI